MLGVRYYHPTDSPKDGANSDAANSDAAAVEDSQSEIKDSDLLKQDLEAKNKEIIDLKVRPKLREPQCYLFSRPHTLDM